MCKEIFVQLWYLKKLSKHFDMQVFVHMKFYREEFQINCKTIMVYK